MMHHLLRWVLTITRGQLSPQLLLSLDRSPILHLTQQSSPYPPRTRSTTCSRSSYASVDACEATLACRPCVLCVALSLPSHSRLIRLEDCVHHAGPLTNCRYDTNRVFRRGENTTCPNALLDKSVIIILPEVGPAPLAMDLYLNAYIAQRCSKHGPLAPAHPIIHVSTCLVSFTTQSVRVGQTDPEVRVSL